MTLTSFSSSLEDLGDKFLYPRYLLTQPMEFHQICLNISLGQALELIRFGDFDLIFKVTGGFRYTCMKFSLKMRYLMSHCLVCHQTNKDLPEC